VAIVAHAIYCVLKAGAFRLDKYQSGFVSSRGPLTMLLLQSSHAATLRRGVRRERYGTGVNSCVSSMPERTRATAANVSLETEGTGFCSWR